MFKNHLKIAYRTLRRRPGYTFINVFGLAVGLACCVLIGLFVRDELAYDRFHENADRVYRVATDSKVSGSPTTHYAATGRQVGPTLREEYPEVESAARLTGETFKLRRGGQYVYERGFYAEPAFFDVFTFPLLHGDTRTALTEPYSLVLTERAAQKHFGRADVVGQALTVDDSLTFTVTGVMADVPEHSHLQFDFLASFSTHTERRSGGSWDWTNFWWPTYVLLREDADAEAFEAKIAGLVTQRFGDEMADVGYEIRLVLEPLARIYLHSGREGALGPTGDVRYVYVFAAIALFILLIACINFVNLATARSVERAKEVGVRKVVGSSQGGLVRQFLSEAVLLTSVALVLAVVIVVLALPLLNSISGKDLTLAVLAEPPVILGGVLLALIVGVLAGLYPAATFARFRPAEVLKGGFGTGRRGVRLRQGLVVVQFALSILLIVGTLVVYRQLDFMQAQRLGFDKEQVLVLNLPSREAAENVETVKGAFTEQAGIGQATAASNMPGSPQGIWTMHPEGFPEGESRAMDVIFTDFNYVETMGLEVVAGRDLSTAFGTDSAATLINETGLERIGWMSEEALGKTIAFGNGQELTVVGVVRDYHHTAPKNPVEPILLTPVWPYYQNVALRLQTSDVRGALAQAEGTWRQLFPDYAFDYFFLDARYNEQYRAERRLGTLFGLFAGLAILIACLGLFGLAAYVTAQRTKEIGVRKVLGASVTSIVALLSKDFLGLVAVAFVIAVPVAWWAMRRWLEGFASRVDLGLGVFLLAGALALVIALATVSYHALRAATADPVKSLRYE